MKGIRKSCLTLVLLAGLVSPLVGGVEIILQLSSSSEALRKGAETEPPSVALTTLSVYDDLIGADDQGVQVLFDRNAERLLTLDPEARQYSASSLFALFEFRYETYLSLAKLSNFGYDPALSGGAVPEVLVDHIFGFTRPGGTAQPQPDHSAEKRRWVSGDFILASWSTEGTEVSPEVMDLFVFWVRQSSGGHPIILEDLWEGGLIPDTLVIYQIDGTVRRTVEMDLVGVREVPDQPLEDLIGDYTQSSGGEGQNAIVTLLDWLVSGNGVAESISVENLATAPNARAAFEAGDAVRGILETLRFEMATGLSPEVELSEYDGLIRSSRTASNIVGTLGASTPDQYERGVQTLDVLSESIDGEAAVLKVLIGEYLARIGKFADARRIFREAVLEDPGLAIAYKNLGDISRAAGRYPLGWQFYEAFQLVAPEHPANGQINELKSSFVDNFPGFF